MKNRLSKYSPLFWEKCCFLTAYLHVISIIIEAGAHILMVLISTEGLQCDADLDLLHKNWIIFEKYVHISTLGVHGFTPFMAPYSGQLDGLIHTDDTDKTTRRCSSGFIHLPALDALIISLNMIWLKFVVSFYYSQYKKDVRKMQLFLHVAMLKLFMELVYNILTHKMEENIFDFALFWDTELLKFLLYISMLYSVYYRIKFLQKGTVTAAPKIAVIQTEGDKKTEEKTEQSIADKKKPPACLLV